jgi:hypothetical protein
MGWSPAQVDDSSLWQIHAAWQGYLQAHNPDQGPPPLTNAEHDALVEKYAHI